MKVDVNFDEQLFNPLFYPLLFDESRYLVIKGSAGSGKSVFAAQNFIIRLLSEEKNRFVCVRKVHTTIRNSQWKLINDLIRQYGLMDYFDPHDTTMTMRCRVTGSELISVGMDDREKVKSLAEPTSIWYEEPTELEKHDFLQMSMRLRGIKENKMQEILTFNPVSDSHWIKDMFFPSKVDKLVYEKKALTYKKIVQIPDEEPEEILTTVCHSTYKDNLFIDRKYKAQLESYKEIDENYYRIYCLGMWGTLGKTIFNPIRIEDIFPDNDYFDDIIYGLDWGFVHPAALLKIGIKRKEGGDEFHVKQLFYESGYTKMQLAEHIKEKNLIDYAGIIYCDSAEPDGIEDLRGLGLNAVAAIKGNDSVLAGIDLMKSLKIISYKENYDFNKEWEEYKYKTDSDEKLVMDSRGRPAPIKIKDDAISAARYAIYSYYKQPELKMAFIGG